MKDNEDRLLLLLSGELTGREGSRLDQALTKDADLASQLADLRQIETAVAALPCPTPSRDLVAGALRAAATPRSPTMTWPLLLRIAAVALATTGAATVLYGRIFTAARARCLAKTVPVTLEEAVSLTPRLLSARRRLARTRRHLVPAATSESRPHIPSLHSRFRQARNRLRAIKKRHPDLPEDDNNNGATRQEGVGDETCNVDRHLFAANSGTRVICPRGRT